YTSYPTAAQFAPAVGAQEHETWLKQLGRSSASLYIHVPFCAERCDYCEFYSVPVGRTGMAGAGSAAAATTVAGAGSTAETTARDGTASPAAATTVAGAGSSAAPTGGGAGARDELFDRFIAALLAEWQAERARFGVRSLETVFVGGGTPSLLTPRAEVTVETNPEDVTPSYAAWAAKRRLRVSLGVQSFDARLRANLGRRGATDPAAAFARLREAGVGVPRRRLAAIARHPAGSGGQAGVSGGQPGVSGRRLGAAARRPGASGLGVDLIFGLPGQDAAGVEAELAAVERLRPDHVSYYELSVAPDTVLGARVALTDAGRMGWGAPELPDDETVALMYRRIVAALGRLGYEWYEVSNFALPGYRCCHNSAVWRGGDYLGIGPGAVGTVAAERRRDVPDVTAYLAALEHGAEPPRELEALDAATRARERLLLAARTGERVPLAALAGVIDDGALPALAGAGLVSLAGGTLRVTRKGRYVANGVCVRLFRDSSFLEA
ncbi:MAG: coproporphyrinogen-III oxidase family protein, partial [Thermoleophilia bacterium]